MNHICPNTLSLSLFADLPHPLFLSLMNQSTPIGGWLTAVGSNLVFGWVLVRVEDDWVLARWLVGFRSAWMDG